MTEPFDTSKIIEECRSEIQSLRRELYGNPDLRQKGVYERLDILEGHVSSLERARVEGERLERMEAAIKSVELKLQINNVYLRGLVWGGAAVMVPVLGAGLIALFSYLFGGG